MNRSMRHAALVGFGLAALSSMPGITQSAGTEANAPPVEIEGLARQAALGFSVDASGAFLAVRELERDSPAGRAGLRDADVIETVNGTTYDKPYVGQALLRSIKAGARVTVGVRRGDRRLSIAFSPAPRPLERIPGLTSVYGAIETTDGARLRTIVATPADADKALPPLLFAQWVSCGSIEFSEADVDLQLLAKIAREANVALVRVERSSDGDSEGPECHQLDYDTELANYIHAFKRILKSGAVDASRVFISGSSLGSTTAPLIAHALQDAGYDIAGIAVQGGGAETYYERMLTFDRHYLERRPDKVAPADIHDELIARARFHYEYLINRRDPDAIARDSSEMAAVRRDVLGLGDGEHYGRPYAWHQQAARHNFLAAWAALDAPVLVIFNEFDQFEARYGHRLIVDMINRIRPGAATYVEQRGVDHNNSRYRTIEEAYAWKDGVPAWEETADVIIAWLSRIRSAI